MTTGLPEHSTLGASSAERWMKCPGSVTLTRLLREAGQLPAEDPEYRLEGTLAHALAAHCLTAGVDAWEADEVLFPALIADLMAAVQVYLNYVRSIPGTRLVEHKMHRPEFHELAYGTGDAIVLGLDALHIIDYKHGVGIPVEIEENVQVQYYAYLYIGDDDNRYPDGLMVRLTIVQPRVSWHPDGVVRTWETSAGAIRLWARNELRPAMARALRESYVDMGEHCRFCPAKLVCPALLGLAAKALQGNTISWQEAQQLKMIARAAEQRARDALFQGQELADAKLVYGRSNRVWAPGNDAKLLERYGEAAWQKRELMSPAMVEDNLPGGKGFVAEHAYKPRGNLTIVPIADKKPAVKVEPEATFMDRLKASAEAMR